MSNKFICSVCNKSLSSQSNLNKHLKTICLREESLVFNCIYCTNNFTTKSILDKHILTCPKKNEYLANQQIAGLNTKIQELTSAHEKQLKELTTTHENQIRDLTGKYNSTSKILKAMQEDYRDTVSEKDKKIEFLKGQIKILEQNTQDQQKQIERLRSVTNIVNNTINNSGNMYIQNLEPITDELINETGKKVGMMDLKDGVPGIMRKFQPVLKDRIICTDATRNSLMYNYNGKLKRDSHGQMITDKIIKSTEPQYKMYKDDIVEYYTAEGDKELTETQREKLDSDFGRYQEYSRAVKSDSEMLKKRVSNNISKRIANFSKSKTQFDEKVNQVQQQVESGATPELCSVPQDPQRGRLNPVVSTRQTLINGRIIEQHFDQQGNVVRQIRIRSSGLPYLTDEETDPSSREQSDCEQNDCEQSDCEQSDCEQSDCEQSDHEQSDQ